MQKTAYCFFCCLTALICLTSLSLFGCDNDNAPQKISLNKVRTPTEKAATVHETEKLRVAVSAIISPRETFVIYQDLLGYLSRKAGISVQLIQRDTYEEVNELVKENKIDMAFVCSGAYVNGHDEFGMELLAAPKAFGKTVYHSYIIVPGDSPVTEFSGLRGKLFPLTTQSGRWRP